METPGKPSSETGKVPDWIIEIEKDFKKDGIEVKVTDLTPLPTVKSKPKTPGQNHQNYRQ